MNYSQTLEYLFTSLPSFQEVGSDAYKPGLERITEFCRHMGNPQRYFYTIHVAGTNGKGSVSHMLASVLQEAGYCVGLYTSPHLEDFRERVRVNGEKIPKQKVVNFIDKNRAKMEELELSFFEMTTALAFDYFAQSSVEVAIIETGLGGRLDATNVIVPILSIVTNIAIEHKSLLGDTLEKIAAEKAGIMKKSIPLVLGEASDEYNRVFEERGEQLHSPVIYAQKGFQVNSQNPSDLGQIFNIARAFDGHIFDVELDLAGEYQRQNIVTVIAAADYLHRSTPLSISRRAFTTGMRQVCSTTGLRGRWQKLSSSPLTICDTGHNPHGLRRVVEQIASTPYAKLFCVMGFASDKELGEILPMLPTDAHYIFTAPNNRRALPAAELEAQAAHYNLKGEVVAGVANALERVRSLAAEDDMIFVGGSNFVVAEIE